MAQTEHARARTGPRGGLVGGTALVLFVVFAGLIAAIVLMLGRQASRSNVEQAAAQLTSSAEVAAADLRARRADVRARASRLAILAELQHAIANRDFELLQRVARTHHARIDAFGTRVGTLPRAPRFASTVIISTEGRAVARVTVGLALDAGTLDRVQREALLPANAKLLLVDHRSARLDGARLDVGGTRYVAGSAPMSLPGMRVVAISPFSDVSARTAHYLRRVLIAALLTLLVAAGVAVRLARPLARAVDDLRDRAERDPLTGIANRRLIDDRLREELDRARRHGTHLALVLIDIDDFKQVNDRHGHSCGDEVLRGVADVLSHSVRELDLAGRFGGEEFAIVLPGTPADAACRVAEQIRRRLSAVEVTTPAGEQIAVTASFGVADFPATRDVQMLIDHADKNLYEAKKRGKNQVVGRRADEAEWLPAVPRAPA